MKEKEKIQQQEWQRNFQNFQYALKMKIFDNLFKVHYENYLKYKQALKNQNQSNRSDYQINKELRVINLKEKNQNKNSNCKKKSIQRKIQKFQKIKSINLYNDDDYFDENVLKKSIQPHFNLNSNQEMIIVPTNVQALTVEDKYSVLFNDQQNCHPKIVQNFTQTRCSCRKLECCTNICKCYQKKEKCTIYCGCDLSCQNHQHSIQQSQSSEEDKNLSSDDQSQNINAIFIPVDFSAIFSKGEKN